MIKIPSEFTAVGKMMIDLDNPTHSCQRGCNTPVRALRVTMGAAENVDDVTALKLAHASLKDMGEGLMRSLLTGLLTATAADKPACFVAVRVARSIVQHISECDASEAHPRHTSDSNSLSPVPRLDLGQRQEGEEGGGRRAQDARPASVQNGPDRATAHRRDAIPQRNGSESGGSSSRSDTAGGNHSSRSAGSNSSHGSGGSTSRRRARAPVVSGAESFLKPVERLTQTQRRERAKQQREHAAIVAQRFARGWRVRRDMGRRAAAALVIQRVRKHRVWRHALAEAGRARERHLAVEAAAAEQRAEDMRQRAEFDSWREFVNTDIPEELQRGTLLHYAAVQITACWRGSLTRAAVSKSLGWSLAEARKARVEGARDARERADRAAEDAARAREIERAEAAATKARLEKEEQARLARAKKARAEVLAQKQREARAKAVKADADKRVREREERDAREIQEKAEREERAAQRAAEELQRRQQEESERSAREELRQKAQADADAKAAAAAAEWEAAHKRLKDREAQYKKDSAAAVLIQRVARGILTRRVVAEQIAAEAEAMEAEVETKRLMAEATAEAERKQSLAKSERRYRYEEQQAAEADKVAEEERRLARKAAAEARTLAARAAQQAEAAAIRRAEAAVAREARMRREEALLLQKRAEIEAVEWRSISATEKANAVSRPASALPPVAIGVGWRGDTPLGTDHHHERREIDELRQMQDSRRQRSSGSAARRGRHRPGSAPVLSLSEWEWKMEADEAAGSRPQGGASRGQHGRGYDQRSSASSGRTQSAKPRLVETSRGAGTRRPGSGSPGHAATYEEAESMGANGDHGRSNARKEMQHCRGRSAGPARTRSTEERDAEMRRSSEAMGEFLRDRSQELSADGEDEDVGGAPSRRFGRKAARRRGNGPADDSDDEFFSSDDLSENESSHYLDEIESARRGGYDQHQDAFDSAINRVARTLSATGKLQELSPEPYVIAKQPETRTRGGAPKGRLQDSTNLSDAHRRRPTSAAGGSGSRGATNKLAALPRELPNNSSAGALG